MTLSLRIFVGYFLIVGLTGLFVLNIVVTEVKPSVRETIEETMVDTANILAALAADELKAGTLAKGHFADSVSRYSTRSVDARIWHFRKTTLDFRIYVTDAGGKVVFDSEHRAEGMDFSQWNDVRRTLAGHYGARSTQDSRYRDASTVFHVAAPIIDGEHIIGSLTVSKPIARIDPIIRRSENAILRYGFALIAVSLAVGLYMTVRLQLSIRRLQRYARAVAGGESMAAPRSSARELNELAGAMADMRQRLDGKQYVEGYVQALTHELKSPLAAVAGAAELLTGDLPPADRQHFAHSVKAQAARMQSLIDRLLRLSRLESLDRLDTRGTFDLAEVARRTASGREAAAQARRIALAVHTPTSAVPLAGDADLMELAIGSLLDNALDFSPDDGRIVLAVERSASGTTVRVRDDGAGIPDYALPRIFERFYSLPRPRNGGRSSGLGLAIVQQIAALHGATVAVDNHPEGGVEARLTWAHTNAA
ncbi:MAG: two-component system sensor histidine kinase CreC [Rhodocyclaceae bacterium]